MKRKIRHAIGGIKGACIIILSFLLFPFARLFLLHKKIWIVSEHGYEARDNGYSFFKYMRKEHPEVNCYYAIDFKSPDYSKIEELGNAIRFGSYKHFAYYCAARYIISSKTQGFCPNYYLTLLRKKLHLWGKYVFLQHGITKDDQKFLYKKAAKIDLFICGAKPEYEDIKSHYGYKENEVAYTGFARFDDYFVTSTKNQILVMPTWRRYTNLTDFCETDYFKNWSNFINSKEIDSILDDNKCKLIFYLHPQFKDYTHFFVTCCKNIKVVLFNESDLQTMIKESRAFITDFSSLAFDFGYMKRPVIYFQFDEDKYFKEHYIKGYFDYRRDGFGPVCNSLNETVQSIKQIFENNYVVSSKYLGNQERFFPLCDKKNSKRIFEIIKNL